ncbi:MAG: hypothetical protein ACI8T1_000662 [Verrucomicrobiales bacterium]|jgi:hypothetical protein
MSKVIGLKLCGDVRDPKVVVINRNAGDHVTNDGVSLSLALCEIVARGQSRHVGRGKPLSHRFDRGVLRTSREVAHGRNSNRSDDADDRDDRDQLRESEGLGASFHRKDREKFQSSILYMISIINGNFRNLDVSSTLPNARKRWPEKTGHR